MSGWDLDLTKNVDARFWAGQFSSPEFPELVGAVVSNLGEIGQQLV